MASKRTVKLGDINKIRALLESKFDEEFEAEQKLLKMERAMGLNNATSSDPIGKDDLYIDPDAATIPDMMRMLNLLSGRIGQLNRRMKIVQKEVANVKCRVVRVEKTMNETLSSIELMKHMVMGNEIPVEVYESESEFEFEPLTNETELNELENRLWMNPVYAANIADWMQRKITHDNPEKRMRQAIDILIDRQFLPHFTWSGRNGYGSTMSRRIPMCAQTNILELFRVVGSTELSAITAAFVKRFFCKNLRYAKNRLSSRRHECRTKRQPMSADQSDTDEDLL